MRVVLEGPILLRGMVRVLLRAIVSEDFFRDLGSVQATGFLGRFDDISALHGIIETRVPERRPTRLVDAESASQVLDLFLRVR